MYIFNILSFLEWVCLVIVVLLANSMYNLKWAGPLAGGEPKVSEWSGLGYNWTMMVLENKGIEQLFLKKKWAIPGLFHLFSSFQYS